MLLIQEEIVVNCQNFTKKNNRDASLFHNRVVNYWNRLPDSVVMAPSISCFKKRLSEVDFNQLFGCF